MSKQHNELLPSLHWFDRMRQIVFIALGLAAFEIAFPIPFLQSPWGKAGWFLITFFTVKNLIRKRREESIRFNKKVIRAKSKYDKYVLRLSDNARYRMYRLVRIVAVLYIWGWGINAVTEKCNDTLSCVVATPSLIVENFAELLFFAIRLALSFVSLFMTMFLIGRQGLFEEVLPHSIKTRFADVYGQSNAVAAVKEVVSILNDPSKVEALGGFMPGGILLTGPPGTGKTLIAEAVAGEVNFPLIKLGPDAFTSIWHGGGQMKVKEAFRAIRKRALKYGGVVVFMDEIDAIGSRSGVGNSLSEDTWPKRIVNAIGFQTGNPSLQTLLAEMQGMKQPRGLYNKIRKLLGFELIPPPDYRILWIGATNLASKLDEALLRPGRIDRIIPVPYPDQAGIVETLEGYLAKVPNSVTAEQVGLLAVNNPRSTGATIKNTVNEALLKAIREGRDSITWEDMRDAIIAKNLGDELGRTKHEEDNRRVTLHEAAHAVAAILYRPHSRIQFASVVRRGRTGGVVSSAPVEERFTQTRDQLEGEILVSLASVWAEKFFFEDNLSTGPSSDLKNATRIAKLMWSKWAMGSSLMVMEPEQLGAEQTAEIHEYLHALYETLSEALYKYKDIVEAIAVELDQKGTIDGNVCYEIFDRLTT